MSTKDRYSDAVMKGLYAASYKERHGKYKWVSVGQVAMMGGVSRATAKKYLEMGVDDGTVKGIETGLGVCYKPSVKEVIAS